MPHLIPDESYTEDQRKSDENYRQIIQKYKKEICAILRHVIREKFEEFVNRGNAKEEVITVILSGEDALRYRTYKRIFNLFDKEPGFGMLFDLRIIDSGFNSLRNDLNRWGVEEMYKQLKG